VSRLRLQAWATNRRGTEYTVNLDGVPLGCDGLFSDPAVVRFAWETLTNGIGEG
jgi:hypothetical protein